MKRTAPFQIIAPMKGLNEEQQEAMLMLDAIDEELCKIDQEKEGLEKKKADLEAFLNTLPPGIF